ncbi:YfhO family protein [Clostridium sp. YIM B02569]|uniref:YfhO family protein n=1 Tax=Clostridium sp. YIM B02569 TaxID=2911967 RepID=UPI001EEC2E30|nr:YfhO family protein [Clostridium sp. YIM B02569]
MKKIIYLFRDKYVKIYSLVFFIITAIVFAKFIFGNNLLIYTDTGSDTYYVYWPFYKFILQSIKEGTFSLWSFHMGIGTNIFSLTDLMFDPFNIILIIFPIKMIPYGIVLLMIIKLYISGLIFYLYLNMIGINVKVTILGSLIWAFNGYIVLWGQHYMFATEVVLFTIIIYGLEMFFRNGKKGIFIAGLTLLLINSAYMSYAVSIYIFIYSTIRFLIFKKFKLIKFLKYSCKVVVVYLISIGISAIVFIPSCYLILSSPRVSSNSKVPDLFQNYFNMASTLTRLFSNNLMGTTNYIGYWNYYEDMILSSAILMILLIPQLFIIFKEKRKVISLIIILVILSISSPIVSYGFNGFSTVAYRWSYLIIFTIVLGGIFTLNKIIDNKNINKNLLLGTMISLIIVLVISVCCVLVSTNKQINPINLYRILIQCAFIISIIVLSFLMLIFYTKKKKKQYIYILFVITLLDLTSNSYIALNMRNTLNTSYMNENSGYFDNSNKAIELINRLNSGFYRVDKQYDSVFLNDSVYQNYYGITAYNSLNSTGYLQFAKQYDDFFQNTSQIDNFQGDKRLISFLGVKYILDKGNKSDDTYSYVDTVNDINIYENKEAFPLGFTYDNYILDKDFQKLSVGKKAETILNSVVIDQDVEFLNKAKAIKSKMIDYNNLEFKDLIIDKNDKNLISYTSKNSDSCIIIPLNEKCNSDILLEFNLKSNVDMTGKVYYSTNDTFDENRCNVLNISHKKEKYSIPIDCKNVKNIKIVIGNKDKKVDLQNIQLYEREDMSKSILNKDLFNIDKFTESNIVGKISTDKKKILTWTIPYDKGWKVKVDGAETNTLNVNEGMLGIQLESGQHDIELSYTPQGVVIGGFISIVTIMFILLKSIKDRNGLYREGMNKNDIIQ